MTDILGLVFIVGGLIFYRVGCGSLNPRRSKTPLISSGWFLTRVCFSSDVSQNPWMILFCRKRSFSLHLCTFSASAHLCRYIPFSLSHSCNYSHPVSINNLVSSIYLAVFFPRKDFSILDSRLIWFGIFDEKAGFFVRSIR